MHRAKSISTCFHMEHMTTIFSRKNILKKAIGKTRGHYKQNFGKKLFVGDGVWDYEAACQLNIGFIGIDVGESGKLTKLGAEKVFKDYRDGDSIIKIIKKIEPEDRVKYNVSFSLTLVC